MSKSQPTFSTPKVVVLVCLRVVAGLYDFQIVDDVNITLDVLKGDLQRRRPWSA